MMINKISNITFKENVNASNLENNSKNTILVLKDPNASVKFQQNKEIAQNADAINSNLFKALGYKLYKTFNIIRDNNSEQISKDGSLDLTA